MDILFSLLDDKSKFVDRYLEILLMSPYTATVQCSKPYLMAITELEPYYNSQGFIGLKRTPMLRLFYLPPIYFSDGNPVFVRGIAEIEFPGNSKGISIRRDVQYIYEKENSTRIIRSDRDLNIYLDLDFDCFSVPYDNHDYDDKLRDYYTYITTRYKEKGRFTDRTMFERMLFTDYGQHRFVMFYKGIIIAVIVWSDNGAFINIHFGLGLTYVNPDYVRNKPRWTEKKPILKKVTPAERKRKSRKWVIDTTRKYREQYREELDEYKKRHDNFAKEYLNYRIENSVYRQFEVHYTSTLIRYFFMQRFPPQTLFNDGGVGISKREMRDKNKTKPIAILEVKTSNRWFYYYDNESENKRCRKSMTIGKLPHEQVFYLSPGEIRNERLFAHTFDTPDHLIKNEYLYNLKKQYKRSKVSRKRKITRIINKAKEFEEQEEEEYED